MQKRNNTMVRILEKIVFKFVEIKKIMMMPNNYTIKVFYFLTGILFLLNSYQSHSQINSISSNEYGRLFYLVYDQTTANKLYAVSMNNHIMVIK